jgi:lysophospholipase L1-like esterase
VQVVAVDGETAGADADAAIERAADLPPAAPVDEPVVDVGDDAAPDLRATDIGVVVDPDRPAENVPLPLPLPMPGTVAVVGDSLTVSAADEIDVALTDAGLEVLAVDGLENRRMVRGGAETRPGVDAIDDILAAGHEPELWIVALGTNDVGNGIDEPHFSDDVEAVLRGVPTGAPVIWIDLFIRDRPRLVAQANDAIRSVSAIRPGTLVVDWNGLGDAPGIVTSDGVHLTEAGQDLFAATMAAAVDALFVG